MPQKGGMQTMNRITRVHNPVAASNNRRPQTFKPSKGKPQQKPSGKDYNRQKDEKDAGKHEKDAYQKGEQEST